VEIDRLGEFDAAELRVGPRSTHTPRDLGSIRRFHPAQPAGLGRNRKILLQVLAICPKFLAVVRPVSPLKIAIVASGRTQRDIAAAAGTDEYRLSRIVNGREQPPDDLMAAISQALGRSVGELWPHHNAASDQISAVADDGDRRVA
jgi:plasmid maintenance system antidote protein VapI